MNNTCAAHGCTTPISVEYLMCPSHWRKVPKDIQNEVYSTWRNVRSDRQAYEDARTRAIASVAAASHDPNQRSFL